MEERLSPTRHVKALHCLNNIPWAVLLPVVTVDGEEHVLFEVRSSKLAWQPRDICFPGGKIEAADANAQAAAIRETEEELGIARSAIEILGPLDYLESMVGVTVWPFAARLHSLDFSISKDELDEVFTVPLAWLRQYQPEEKRMEIATRPGPDFPSDLLRSAAPDTTSEWRRRKTYSVYIYRYENHVIWGITAHILRHFLSLY